MVGRKERKISNGQITLDELVTFCSLFSILSWLRHFQLPGILSLWVWEYTKISWIDGATCWWSLDGIPPSMTHFNLLSNSENYAQAVPFTAPFPRTFTAPAYVPQSLSLSLLHTHKHAHVCTRSSLSFFCHSAFDKFMRKYVSSVVFLLSFIVYFPKKVVKECKYCFIEKGHDFKWN